MDRRMAFSVHSATGTRTASTLLHTPNYEDAQRMQQLLFNGYLLTGAGVLNLQGIHAFDSIEPPARPVPVREYVAYHDAGFGRSISRPQLLLLSRRGTE